MKISRISVYQVDLPLHEGSYNWSGGKSVAVFDSTVVRIDTDAGLAGFGEICPLGPFYLPSYAAGARTGISELAPDLIDEDEAFERLLAPDMQAKLARQNAALSGEMGALLWAVSTSDGSRQAEYSLPSVPVWDGMAAAAGRLYLATTDGEVLCFGGR